MASSGGKAPHYEQIAKSLKAGYVVPFLGAGASISCELPSGGALARRLAEACQFPDKDNLENLALVASYYLAKTRDELQLYHFLREMFDVRSEPSLLHACLAKIDSLDLIVTTNYDDLVERALAPRNPWIVVDRGTAGKVRIRPPDGEWNEVQPHLLSKEYPNRPLTVFKMHGSFDRINKDNDSILITEDQYVDFLGRPETAQIPSTMALTMMRRNLLFLGYGLKDWNVRVLLRKLRPHGNRIKSWAIVKDPSQAELELWEAQNITAYDIDLCDFAGKLEQYL